MFRLGIRLSFPKAAKTPLRLLLVALLLSASWVRPSDSYSPFNRFSSSPAFTNRHGRASSQHRQHNPAYHQHHPADWNAVEREILREHNRIRQNPRSYIPILEAHLETMDGRGNIPGGLGPGTILLTQEGASAVYEAIDALWYQKPVQALQFHPDLQTSARQHAFDQRNGGRIGHAGTNGSTHSQRINDAMKNNDGLFFGSCGENIAYGPKTGQEVVLQLIVDDGVPDRGHRDNIFHEDWNAAGAGCGPHDTIRTVSVVNYAKMAKPSAAADTTLLVKNEGTVPLLSLKAAGLELLATTDGVGPLFPGHSCHLQLPRNLPCRTDLTVQLGNKGQFRYSPLVWDDVYICDAELIVTESNNLRLHDAQK